MDINMFYWGEGITDNRTDFIVLYYILILGNMHIYINELLENTFNIINTNTEIFILFPNLLM